MKTNEFIEKLANEGGPVSGADSESIYHTKWILIATFATAVWLAILPMRFDLDDKMNSPAFAFESAMWAGLASASGLVAYRSRIPGLSLGWAPRITLVIGALLLGEMIFQAGAPPSRDEWLGEMSFWRGRCGPIITLMALAWAGGSFYWLKQGAPAHPTRSGAWAALSAGSLGAFAMQFICAHENTLHLIVWHLIPTTLVVFAGAFAGRRLLRW